MTPTRGTVDRVSIAAPARSRRRSRHHRRLISCAPVGKPPFGQLHDRPAEMQSMISRITAKFMSPSTSPLPVSWTSATSWPSKGLPAQCQAVELSVRARKVTSSPVAAARCGQALRAVQRGVLLRGATWTSCCPREIQSHDLREGPGSGAPSPVLRTTGSPRCRPRGCTGPQHQLELTTGWADARPSSAHHNYLDTDVCLRIYWGELWASKALLVGGLSALRWPPVSSTKTEREHLNDYDQMEFYWAYPTTRP